MQRAYARSLNRFTWLRRLTQSYVGNLVGSAVRDFIADDCVSRAAVIAYATLLSLFPMLLFLLTAIGYVIANPETQSEFVSAVASVFPGTDTLIHQTVDSVVKNRGSATLFATLTLLVSASSVFGAMNKNVNAIWKIPKQRGIVESTVLAVFMVVAVAVVFLVSLGLSTFLQIAGEFTLTVIGLGALAGPAVYPLLAFVLPVVTTTGLFTLVYRFIPNTRIKWSWALQGGIAGGLLFEVGKQLFALYLSSLAHFDTVYGSIGAVIALLTWADYSAIILLFGCEVSHVAAEMDLERAALLPTSS